VLVGAFGTTTVESDVLAVAYYRTKNWPRLISLWKSRTNAVGATAKTWFSLAAAYYAAGDKTNALNSINAAIKLDPSAASAAEGAIKQIKAGQ
jgi:Tfp pilus assembly protein PilF